MAKARRAEIQEAIRQLPPRYRAVLIFGPDEGLVREYAQAIGQQIVEDLKDPFRVVRLGADQIRTDPALVSDEMAAIAMTGGRRLIRIDGAGDAILSPIISALDGKSDSLLLVLGGDLPARSKLRKHFETTQDVLAIACYADEGRDLYDLARKTLEDADLRTPADVLGFLADHLGGDRQLSRNELEKLILYKRADTDRTVSLEDVQACIGDTAALTLSQIAAAVAGGNVRLADRLIEKAFVAGESPVAVLRVVQARFLQLHLCRGLMESGLRPAEAVGKLSPPVFFKDRDAFIGQLSQWSKSRLAAALERLNDTEAECKSTGMPAEVLTSRLCLQLAASIRPKSS